MTPFPHSGEYLHVEGKLTHSFNRREVPIEDIYPVTQRTVPYTLSCRQNLHAGLNRRGKPR